MATPKRSTKGRADTTGTALSPEALIPVVATKRCPWCRNDPRGYMFGQDYRPCSHPEPVEIHALPGAEFRTTKYEVAEGATGAGRAVKPTYAPPKGGLYTHFMTACERAQIKLALVDMQEVA